MKYHELSPDVFILYDGDSYESGNSARQLFDPKFLGMNKAQATEERLSPICKEIVAYSNYLTYDALSVNIEDHYYENVLVILTVDRDKVRHDLILALDNLDSRINFACVLPGNEFRTATCVLHQRIDGTLRFPHPFDVVTNYAVPEDTAPGACGEVAVERPQLICANFASACMVLNVVYSLLEDEPLPFRINFNSLKLSMTAEGPFVTVSGERCT
jgi:hypothetical protein